METIINGGGMSRRRFLRDAGVAAATGTGALAARADARSSRRRSRRPTVAVFGGGIAGLTAAHELAERGFAVTVYERRAWGGKARSTWVSNSARDGRKPLPGEHAYRVEFGCYQNLPETMQRIPFGTNANGVFDNMVETPQASIVRVGKHDLTLPIGSTTAGRAYTPQQVVDLLVGLGLEMQLPPAAAEYLAQRIAVFCSSCDARRLGEWEKTSWTKFVGADRFGEDYQRSWGSIPRLTQASKAEGSSAKYVAWLFESWWLYPLLGLGLGSPGAAWRVLNRPTNEAWIDPWCKHLQRLGVDLRLHHAVSAIDLRGGQIAGAQIHTPRGPRTVTADWYVCALPVERARRLWNHAVLTADPDLARMHELETAWMNGISFYLRERSDILQGIEVCVDSPWAMTFIPQAQFWDVDFAHEYGDGRARDKLSAAVANWTAPGTLFGKAARDLSPNQVALEVWEQMKRHVNKPGAAAKLTDDMLHSWDIDPGMLHRNGHLVSEDPLVLPLVDTEQYRPDAVTEIPNLALCGDYLNGPWEVANMESANFNGRRAANVILSHAAHSGRARTANPFLPPEWEPLRRIDEQRYEAGQPNLFDTDMTLDGLRTLLS